MSGWQTRDPSQVGITSTGGNVTSIDFVDADGQVWTVTVGTDGQLQVEGAVADPGTITQQVGPLSQALSGTSAAANGIVQVLPAVTTAGSGTVTAPTFAGNIVQTLPSIEQSAASSAAFSPADLPGLQVWLEADKIAGLSDTDPVPSWADLSGNGHDFAQGTSGNRPVYRTGIRNGLPVVRFAGSSSQYLLNSDTFTTGTVFTVATKGSGLHWAHGSDPSPEYMGQPSGAPSDFFFQWDADFTASTGYAALASGWATWRGDGDHVMTRNGTVLDTGSNPSGPKSRAAHYIGTRGQLNSFYTGDMALYVVTNAVLSSGDKAALQAYAADKYAL